MLIKIYSCKSKVNILHIICKCLSDLANNKGFLSQLGQMCEYQS